jgi:hypothetical protein
MGKGKRYELTLKNAINEATQRHVKAHRPDYSGSSKGEVADLMVLWDQVRYGDGVRKVAYVELKKRQGDAGKRTTVMSGSSKDQCGTEEIAELLDESPEWTDCYVAVKFDHRELAVFDADTLLGHVRGDKVNDSPYEVFQPRMTPSGHVSMVKPDLNDWNSSTSGLEDYLKLLYDIGVENYDMKEGYY